MTTTVQQPGTTPKTPKSPPKPKAPPTMRELAVAAAGNIGPTDKVAALVVYQADGNFRITPFGLSPLGAIALLSKGSAALANILEGAQVAVPATTKPAK